MRDFLKSATASPNAPNACKNKIIYIIVIVLNADPQCIPSLQLESFLKMHI